MDGFIPRRIDMEKTIATKRLLLRQMGLSDQDAFLQGTADRELRRLYGLPDVMPEAQRERFFRRLCDMPGAYSIYETASGHLTGFVLDVPPELPEDMLSALPGQGRTLTFASFRPYQRRGYMREALTSVIKRHSQTKDAAFIHCGHFPFNEPSRNLLLSLGFQEYGQHTVGQSIIIDKIRFL